MNDYVALGVLIALLYFAHQFSEVRGQIRDIELRLNKLLELQGIEFGKVVEPSAAVKELARTKGAEVEAIRAYRQQTGVGVKEARSIVQALSRTSPGDA